MKPKIQMILLLTTIFWAAPTAQDARAQATTQTNHQNAVGKTRRVTEFIGTLIGVDKQKRTVCIASGAPAKANRDKAGIFLLTPDTKLFKGDAPATLQGAVVGQEIRYGFRLGREGGTNQLTVLRFLTVTKTGSGK